MKWQGMVPDCARCREYLQYLVQDVLSLSVDSLLESNVRLHAHTERFHAHDHKGFTGRQEA